MKTEIIIEPYSSEWPILFQKEMKRISQILGGIHIEHIGSTAVEGISAKPVIDMMAEVSNLNDVEKFIKPLAESGYIYAPELETQTPDRKFFQRRTETGPWYHLSFSEPTSKYWIEHILFRDYLRAHEDARKEYENLKNRLANQHIDDFDKYNADKTEFINSIVHRASISFS